MATTGFRELLIQSALDADLLERLRADPDGVLARFDLEAEERDLLCNPDHRLLAVIGRILRDQQAGHSAEPKADTPAQVAVPGDAPPAIVPEALPPMLLALTIVPCLAADRSLRYAVWVNPMSEGGTPAVLPPPPGATLPGEPLAPLYAVIELDGVRSTGAQGEPQVTLFAQFRQSTNVAPSGQRDTTSRTAAAAAAVHAATPQNRRELLEDLVRALEDSAS